MKRVLVIAFNFPPQGGTGTLRVTKFVRYLPEFGWEPVVICLDSQANYDAGLLAEVPAETEVHRIGWPAAVRLAYGASGPGSLPLPAIGGVRPGGLARLRQAAKGAARSLLIPDVALPWVPGAVQAAGRIIGEGKIDALLTTSPPPSVHLAGWWLKHRFPRLPWVADFRDPWSQSHGVITSRVYRPNYWLERACCDRADRVLHVTDSLRGQALAAFPRLAPGKIITLPNGYDPADLGTLPAHEPTSRLTLAFVGQLSEIRSQTQFVPALLALAEDPRMAERLCVRFVGSVPPAVAQALQPLIASGVVTILPFVPHEAALAEMARADVLLQLEANIPELRSSRPNKLYEYLAVGRPILAVVGEGESTTLVRETQSGLVVNPDDREGIMAGLRELVASWERGDLAGGPPPAGYAVYQRRNLTGRLAQVLDQAVSGRASSAEAR